MENPDYLTRSETSVVLIRFAEVLLTYAEVKIEANDLDASVYEAINLVRARVQMPSVTVGKTQDELRAIVRLERKSEFAFEGLRLYDIRRWKIAEKVLEGKLLGRIPKGLLASAPAIDENGTPDYSVVPNVNDMRVIEIRIFDPAKNYLWPLPQIEMEVNSNLTQNRRVLNWVFVNVRPRPLPAGGSYVLRCAEAATEQQLGRRAARLYPQ